MLEVANFFSIKIAAFLSEVPLRYIGFLNIGNRIVDKFLCIWCTEGTEKNEN